MNVFWNLRMIKRNADVWMLKIEPSNCEYLEDM